MARVRVGNVMRGRLPAELEVLYSRSGQTADDMIERVALRLQPYGEALVVTDDFVERDTVYYHGGMVMSCGNFIADIHGVLKELDRDIARHNRAERLRYKDCANENTFDTIDIARSPFCGASLPRGGRERHKFPAQKENRFYS